MFMGNFTVNSKSILFFTEIKRRECEKKMKPVREILESTLEVLSYIEETTPKHIKYRKKIEKMIREYDEDQDAFFNKYLDKDFPS